MKQTKKREDKEKVNARSRKHRLTKTTKKLEIVGLDPDEIKEFLSLTDLENLSHADKLRQIIKFWNEKHKSKPEQIAINFQNILPEKKIPKVNIKKSNNEISYKDEMNKILDAIKLKKFPKNGKDMKFWIEYKKDPDFLALLDKIIKMTGVPRIKDYLLSNNLNIVPGELRHMIQFPEELQKRILKRAIQVNDYDIALLEFKCEIEILKKGTFKT